jgi:putative Ca2+/H+ antiporter (TMEM165/GDT1 family)
MIAFHRALAAGNSASVALAESQRQLASEDTVAMATAAAFVCVGAEYSLPPTLTRSQDRWPPAWAPEPGLQPLAPAGRPGMRAMGQRPAPA